MAAAPDPTPGRPGLGIALVIGSTLAFAVSPVAARLAYEDGSGTLTVVTLRGAVAAALMALLVLLLRQGFRLDRRAWPATFACGALQGIAVFGFLGAVALVPVGVAVLLFFTHPLLLATVAHLRGTERLDLRKAALMGAVLAGLVLVLGPEAGALDPTGLALGALSAVAISGMILCIGRAQRHATSTQVNLYATGVGTLGTGLAMGLLGAWAPPAGAAGWLGILAAGLGVGFGLLGFFAALRHIGVVRATVLSSVEPLYSILLAAALLGQGLRPAQWAGALVVVLALALFEAPRRAKPAG
ncbi:DMT family transporter [Falsiroseomonas oryziterrae]|uniref:DMT family transporter n=1 Tax=Falsiroseomonas oryziterrae TaxID=2911368 RepID=UPI001F166DD2|nr:DMT family transporter [Roseomonas sp. NPKOSM-4]